MDHKSIVKETYDAHNHYTKVECHVDEFFKLYKEHFENHTICDSMNQRNLCDPFEENEQVYGHIPRFVNNPIHLAFLAVPTPEQRSSSQTNFWQSKYTISKPENGSTKNPAAGLVYNAFKNSNIELDRD